MADISKETIDGMLELALASLLEVEGYAYLDKDKSLTLFTPPVFAGLRVSTLSGFAALIDQGFEGFGPSAVLVHVASFDEVQLIGKGSDKYGRRQVFASAKALQPERSFKFNQYLLQEDFNIALRSMFVQDTELDGLVGLAGNIAAKSEVRQEDDGFTQAVTAKAGVVLVETRTVKPRVTLRPYRTFTEVEQPTGEFIFRVKTDPLGGNACALFEADAGAWKNKAMDTIAAWLRTRLAGSTTTGVGEIPVIS